MEELNQQDISLVQKLLCQKEVVRDREVYNLDDTFNDMDFVFF